MADDLLAAMRDALQEASEKYPMPPGLVYSSPFDFVLQHGRVYEGQWTGKYKLGAQKMCFGNAIMLGGRHDLKYVEGFALAPTGEVIHHAWNDEGGVLVDSTWANTGLIYLGVEFSVARADDATWNGDANILNDENRNYPLFRKPWRGEDYTLTWPSSDRLESLKHPHPMTPPSVAEFVKGFTHET
jgi:hypothetical protein